MPKRRQRDPSPSRDAQPLTQKLFAQRNRGLLLDVLVFIANILVMRLLSGFVLDLFREIDARNEYAKLFLGLIFLAMWILPAAGAVLKRWHFQQRRTGSDKPFESESVGLAGCLFNPIFYFCLNLVITSAVLAALGDVFFGKALTDNGAVFVPLVIAGMLLTIVQTFLIYRYFSPPKRKPRIEFLSDPRSEIWGDVCLFLNMMLFQVFWNLITYAPLGAPSGVLEFGGRLFFLCFIALLIYFPPRMFYLAEDIHRRNTWLSMLLANSPVILRVLIGTNTSGMMGW